MLNYSSSGSKMSLKHNSSTDDDSDYNDQDPGREVIEKNIRNRLQRIADYTKDELNKVLKRVDKTLDNYEYSVQSSLIQHGMTHDDMSNVEHVADIKELEDLLNDSLAKQRYKQRLMIFIVGQTEQASEKAKLLEQIGQFFNEQKQNFSSREFNISDDINEKQDEIDISLKSFDVKDCYVHVKTLGTRLNELNDEIIQYLIQNAGSKQQAKGRKKLAQIAKETRDQLNNLQSKLETANTEMINRDNKIEILEKEIEKIQNETKTTEYKLSLYETEIESYKTLIDELQDNIQEYKNQNNNSTNIEKTTEDKSTETIIPDEIEKEESRIYQDKEIQTSYHSNENFEDLNLLFNSTDEIDLNSLTTFPNLQELAIVRIRELSKELEIKNEIVQKFDEYKKTCEKEQNDWIEKTDSAYQIQIKAQKAAEEAMNQLQFYMKEEDKFKPDLIHQETQTVSSIFQNEQEILNTNISSPELINPIEENLLSQSKIITEEFESIENFRRASLKEKCNSIIEEKKYELDQLKQQAEINFSRPTSIKEQIELQSLENLDILIKRQPSIPLFDSIIDQKKTQSDIELIIKQDQQQQTSFVSSRHSSIHEEKIMTEIIPNDQFKLPFYYLYEIIYKFRYSVINLLEQNKFLSLADCLQMIKQLSIDDNNQINNFIDNAEHVLKDIIKIFQTCIKTLQTTIKEQEIIKESEIITENSLIDNQQSLIIDQKDSTIIDLTTKYEQITKILNQVNKKYEEESNQNERLIIDQQKLMQNLQQETVRLRKRLTKIEYEGIIEPSIMFTRLDAERNNEILQQAVSKGKVPETTYDELNEVMTDYVELPSQQFSNLVKRYIHFRKATALENRIQSERLDNDTKNVLEKMELLYERRSGQISKHMLNIRQQRANLARILTEKFDQLDDESSIFLIRPVYSYQGRAAAQTYMKNVKHRRETLLNENIIRKKHNPSRQSTNNQQMFTPLSPLSTTYDEGRDFHIEKTLPSPRSSLVGQQNDSNENKIDNKHITVHLRELTRLQELDFQRTLMPMSHATTPLLSAFINNGIDPCVPSLNLRSYVALSRPGINNVRMVKPNELIKPVSREGVSPLSAKSQGTNPRTPFNSSAGDLRRTGPPLPPIKRSLTLSVSPIITESQNETESFFSEKFYIYLF